MVSATAWTIRFFGSIVTIRTPSGSTRLSPRVARLQWTHFMLPRSKPVGKTTDRRAYADSTITLHLFSIRTKIIWKRYFVVPKRTKIQPNAKRRAALTGLARRFGDGYRE